MVDLDKVDRLLPYFERVVTDAMRATVIRLEQEGKALIPTGATGQLREQFYTSMRGKQLIMSFGADYAKYIDKGAPPHWIVGHPVLSFPDRQGKQVGKRTDYDGRAVVTRVHHSGIKNPYHFTDKLIVLAKEIFRQELARIYAERTEVR